MANFFAIVFGLLVEAVVLQMTNGQLDILKGILGNKGGLGSITSGGLGSITSGGLDSMAKGGLGSLTKAINLDGILGPGGINLGADIDPVNEVLCLLGVTDLRLLTEEGLIAGPLFGDICDWFYDLPAQQQRRFSQEPYTEVNVPPKLQNINIRLNRCECEKGSGGNKGGNKGGDKGPLTNNCPRGCVPDFWLYGLDDNKGPRGPRHPPPRGGQDNSECDEDDDGPRGPRHPPPRGGQDNWECDEDDDGPRGPRHPPPRGGQDNWECDEDDDGPRGPRHPPPRGGQDNSECDEDDDGPIFRPPRRYPR